MANHKSAKKRARQTVVRTARNKSIRSNVKSAVRSFREALAAGDKEAAKTALEQATQTIRKAGSKGFIHATAVSRRVSRLVKAFQTA